MSQAKKRTVSQRGDDTECDAPKEKVRKFSGQQCHEIYVKEGLSAIKTAEVLTEKIFEDVEMSDEALTKEKAMVKLSMRKKIAKFEQKVKKRSRAFRHSGEMDKTLIQASDYSFFRDKSQEEQAEKSKTDEHKSEDNNEQVEGTDQESGETEPKADKNENESGDENEESYCGDHLLNILSMTNEECVEEGDFLSESDSEVEEAEDGSDEDINEDTEEGDNESTWDFQDMSNEISKLSTSADSTSLLMSPKGPVRTSSQNAGASNPDAPFTPIKKAGTPRGAYRKVPFLTVRKRAQADRLSKIMEQIEDICKDEGLEVDQLCGLALRNKYWYTNKDKATLGQELLRGDKLSSGPRKKLDTVKALYLIERNKLTKAEYMRECRVMREDPNGALLPEYKEVLALKKKMGMGKVGKPFMNGIRADIQDALKYTLQETLTVMKQQGKDIGSEISFAFNYGADGSGKHDQLNNKEDYSTTEVFLGGLTISHVKDKDGTELWTEETKGHNSPYNFRPFLLVPQKESPQLLDAVFPSLDQEIKEIKSKGLVLTIPNHGEVQATLTFAVCRLIDGKMIEVLGGLGGAYCTMCSKSGQDCEDCNVIRTGIKIDRTIEETFEIANRFWDPRRGKIKTGRKDYATRKGITNLPKTTADICRSIAVLHLKIKTVEWFCVSFMVRLNTTRRWQAAHDPQKFSKADENKMKDELKRLRHEVKKDIGIDIGKPDSLPTGPMFYKFSTDSARQSLVQMLIHPREGYKLVESQDEEDKKLVEAFNTIHIQLCAIVRIINSQHRKINVEKFREMCINCNVTFLENFDWAKLSPSLHRALAHSWERIQDNDNYGLGNESEEVLEACNKLVRYYKKHGSRTMSVQDQFWDIYYHIWNASSPLLKAIDPDTKHKQPKRQDEVQVHDLIESMFTDTQTESD